MRISNLTVLGRTDTCVIAELKYAVSNLFSREKQIARKIFKEKAGFGEYWWFLDTGEVVSQSDSINAIISTNKGNYTI